jgi:hypothetical protein
MDCNRAGVNANVQDLMTIDLQDEDCSELYLQTGPAPALTAVISLLFCQLHLSKHHLHLYKHQLGLQICLNTSHNV